MRLPRLQIFLTMLLGVLLVFAGCSLFPGADVSSIEDPGNGHSSPVNLILNWDFSLGMDEEGIPIHWQNFRRYENAYYELSDEHFVVGTKSLKLIDNDPVNPVGVRTHRVDAKPDAHFLAQVDIFAEEGAASVYIDYLDTDGKRVQEKAVGSTKTQEWETLSIDMVAPEGTAYITLILYSSTTGIGNKYFDNVRLFDITP